MEIKIASCEDNQIVRKMLTSFFNNMKEIDKFNINVDFFINAEQLLISQKNDYDIYVLDIDLGEKNMNGMQLAHDIRQYDNKAIIIFLTSVVKYLKEGYKVKAFRYLTKPITYKEFRDAIHDAIDDIEINEKRFVSLDITHNRYHKVKLCDIYYIETNGRKTVVHTKHGNIDCNESISSLTKKLEDRNFYRCHNSYLINLIHVDNFDGSDIKIKNQNIIVSRNKIKNLENNLKRFYKVSN